VENQDRVLPPLQMVENLIVPLPVLLKMNLKVKTLNLIMKILLPIVKILIVLLILKSIMGMI